MKEVKRGNPLINVLKEEWKYLGRRRKIFLFYMFLFVIAGVVSLFTPLIIGLIFNTIQQDISSQQELTKLIYLIFSLLLVQLGFWTFHGAGRVLEEKTGFFVQRNLINAKVKKVLELPVKWHKDHHSGDTIDKINKAGMAIGSFSKRTTFNLVYSFLNMFGSLIILFFIDVYIATFALVFSLSVIIVVVKFDKVLIGYYDEINTFENKASASIFDYISNIFTVITLRLKSTVSKTVHEKIMDGYDAHRRSVNLNELKWGFASTSITLMTVLVLSYKAYTDYNSSGIILIGTLYILYGYLRRVGETFYKFANLYGTINNYDAKLFGAKIIDDEFENVKESVYGNLPPYWDEVEIRGLDFSYDERGKKKHLDNIDLKIKRGQKIALVGESGSGKSTILSVLRGLYNPEKGDVYYNDKKIINGFSKLKHHITLIPQDPEIFNNTILYNVSMDSKVSREELDKAVSMAQFEKVVERLDKGLKTNVLEKGVSLSGGEKQRLALARGILAARKSDIVLMDEPTSSVDSVNEFKIHNNLFKEFKDKTIISSIHRLHLLNKFDYIYLFDKGKIVAEGTLNEIKKNPKFASILRKSNLEDKKKN